MKSSVVEGLRRLEWVTVPRVERFTVETIQDKQGELRLVVELVRRDGEMIRAYMHPAIAAALARRLQSEADFTDIGIRGGDCIRIEDGGNEAWFFREEAEFEAFRKDQERAEEDPEHPCIPASALARHWHDVAVEDEEDFLRYVDLLKQAGFHGYCLFEPV
jgi:hypothetical protein